MRSLEYAVSAWECVEIIGQIIMNDMISSLHTNCHELIVRANKDWPTCWFCFRLTNNIQTFNSNMKWKSVTYFHSTRYSSDILTSTCLTGRWRSLNLCKLQLSVDLILILTSPWVYLKEWTIDCVKVDHKSNEKIIYFEVEIQLVMPFDQQLSNRSNAIHSPRTLDGRDRSGIPLRQTHPEFHP